MVLKHLEQNRNDFGVSVQKVRHDVFRELAHNVGCSLSDNFALVLHSVHQNLRVKLDVLLDTIKQSIAITDMPKNLEASLPHERIVLVAAEKHDVFFKDWVNDRQRHLNRKVMQHIEGQRMRGLFFIWDCGVILTSQLEAGVDDLLEH